MRRTVRPLLFTAALLSVVAASCVGGEPAIPSGGTDGGAVAEGGGAADARDAAETDATHDATAADAPPEAAIESGADAGGETGTDGGPEAGGDAAKDTGASVDSGAADGPTDSPSGDAHGDAGADGAADASDGAVVAPNLIFVTALSFTGAAGGLAGLDADCQSAAQAAGLTGTFIAYASSSTVGIASRVASARGWVRTDGMPVADTPSRLTSGKIWYPIDVNEHGLPIVAPPWVVATGSTSAGQPYPNQTCTDWSSSTATDTYIGNEVGTEGDIAAYTEGSCGDDFRLVCLQTSQVAAVSVVKATGRHAFLSSAYTPGGGLASADARCQADATSGSLTGTYLALVATSTASAASRFDTTGPAWVRPDGVPVFAQASDLSTLTMVAPPCVDATGTQWTFNAAVWTGASDVSTPGTLATTCQDWASGAGTNTGSTGLSGFLQINGVTWFRANGPVACSSIGSTHLVCLEK